VNRPLWSVGLGILTVIFAKGHGSWVRSALGAKFFLPLSKLTFGAYLWHPIIQLVWIGSQRNFGYYYNIGFSVQCNFPLLLFLHSSHFFKVCGVFMLSYAASYLSFLLVEGPGSNLEQYFLFGKRK